MTNQGRTAKKQLDVLFWNLENLFDDKDDPDFFDDNINEYWTSDLYELKIKNLCEILNPWAQRKAVLSFAEIENRAVLEKLRLNLPNQDDYTIIYHHNDFARIKQGMLCPIQVRDSQALDYAKGMRPILRADLLWENRELIIFVNHWKSRRGGDEHTSSRRMEAARFLSTEINKIRKQDRLAEILVIGDFNDGALDKSIKAGLHTASDKSAVSIQSDYLYNFMEKETEFEGTHYHEGEWQTFDQALVSPGLLDKQNLFVKDCRILHNPELIYKNHRPNRFGGADMDNSKRGYSDHLPILVSLGINQPDPGPD